MSRAAAPVVRDLGPGPSAEELTVRAAHLPGLVCLRGEFADGRPLLTSHPIEIRDTVPPDEPGTDDGDLVGGGWFGVAGFGAASTRFALHDHVVRLVDGRWRFEALAPHAGLDERVERWRQLVATPAAAPTWTVGEWVVPDRDPHLAAVERAVELIRAGELYQVNVCTRFAAPFAGSAAALFAHAATELDPAFGALLPSAHGTVVCLSPELFWRRRGRQLTSAPIKGTLPTGSGNAERLRASTKDVAENVMIVDLVRNDLGRVCEPGSVRPTALLDVVERLGVLHLVSTVTGRLRGGAEVMSALFPPASVTGTPKLRALDAIGGLEAAPRGAYTGAVGFVSPLWGAEFAVAIRTLEIAHGRIELGVGGGVTVDSVPAAEWQECLHKARPVLRAAGGAATMPAVDDAGRPGGLLETVLAVDGIPLRLADHLARLDRSSRELYGQGIPAGLAGRVAQAAAGRAGRTALRIVLTPDGAADVTARRAGGPPAPSSLHVATRPAGSWRHKWADRNWLADSDALFLTGDGTVLETGRGNVVLLRPDGGLVTAPLRDDLLPGVTRRALLDQARDTGRPTELRGFTLAELTGSVACWTSSLSGAVPIASVDGVELPRADAAVAELSAALGVDRVATSMVVS